jgi:hypothetical protein
MERSEVRSHIRSQVGSHMRAEAAWISGAQRGGAMASRGGTGRTASLCAALLALPQMAESATVFDIAGTGTVTVLNADGSNGTGQTVDFVGTVTLAVYGAPDEVHPGSAAGGAWVASSFAFSWTGAKTGSFISAPLPAETVTAQHASVFDDLLVSDDQRIDAIGATKNSATINAQSSRSWYVEFTRQTTQTSWLSGLAFPEAAGLAPGSAGQALNIINFGDYTSTDDAGVLPGSYTASFFLSSMTVSPAVPEPGTFALFCGAGLGLAGPGFARRRRVSAQGEAAREASQ